VERFLFAGALGLLASSYAFAANDATPPFAARHATPRDASTSFTGGAKVPDNVVLQRVAANVYDRSSELRSCRFFRWKNQAVFADPNSRRIVGIIG
jgi:hypothetical protein